MAAYTQLRLAAPLVDDCAGPGTSGPSRDRCSAHTGSGSDSAVSAPTWALPPARRKAPGPAPTPRDQEQAQGRQPVTPGEARRQTSALRIARRPSKILKSQAEYKGINTRWLTAEGQRFEVQFHTPDSFHAKNHVTHLAYERLRDTSTSRAELRELHAFQRQVSSRIQAPDGAADIPDYKERRVLGARQDHLLRHRGR